MKRIITFIIAALVFAQAAYSAAFDRMGMGARAKGMGDAFTAVCDDYSSIYWNPAGLAKVKKKTMSLAYKNLYGLGLMDYASLGYVQPGFGQGAAGFSWTRLGTTKSVSFIEYSENTFAFAYGANLKRPFKNLSIGVGAKYYLVDYQTGRASGAGLDIGLKFQKGKFSAALVGQDVNTPAIWWQTGTKDTISPNYRFGVAYFGNFATIGVDMDQLKAPKKKLHIGFEKWFKKDVFAVRAGAFNVTEALWNTTFGATIPLTKTITTDYAFEIHNELGNTHLFTVNSRF